MSLTSWFLVSSGGTRHRLPREMIFVGRDDCELMLQSRSVDKQHAVINYEDSSDEHKVKDLGSLNGTFVNDIRIPEQTYITLKLDDKLRFGYDTNLFTVVRGELRVPEEALKHEKFTSQLQLSQKPLDQLEASKQASARPPDTRAAEAKAEPLHKVLESVKSEEKNAETAAMPRGTPLYGQPSWWGDDDADDENSFKQDAKSGSKKTESGASGDGKAVKKLEEQPKTVNEEALYSLCREPSYFEIPTKEFHQSAQPVESSIHEIPTKDTESSHAVGAGHASFTIEFDDTSPGKVTIKDHVTKFNPEHRHKPKKPSPSSTKELSGLQAAMMAAESKVADWLAQNDPPRMRRESTEEDSKSIKSDVPVYLKRLKGSKHDDGTQSDSENGGIQRHSHRCTVLEEHLRVYHAEQKQLRHKGQAHEKSLENPILSRTSFMIEFFDEDNPRKRRSYSFTQNAAALNQEGPYPVPPARPERAKAECKGVSSPLVTCSAHPKTSPSVQPAKVLLKQKSEEPSVSLASSQTALLRSSGSVGHKPSQSQEMEKQPKIAVDKDNDDDQSDKGTYTIELENPNPEEEAARRMIDKVFGVEEGKDHTRPVIPDGVKEQTTSPSAVTSNGKKSTSGLLELEGHQENPFGSGSPRWVSQWASLAANHTGHDHEDLRSDSPAFAVQEKDVDLSGASSASATSQNERKRRTLPQLPVEDKVSESLRAKVPLHHRSEIGEKQDTEPQEKERNPHASQKGKRRDSDTRNVAKTNRSADGRAHKGDKESISLFQPDAHSKSSKEQMGTTSGSSVVKQAIAKIQLQDQIDVPAQWAPSKPTSASRHLSGTSQADKSVDGSSRRGLSTTHKTKDKSETKSSALSTVGRREVQSEDKRMKTEVPLQSQSSKGGDGDKRDSSKPLVRQGSFTIDKPSANVPIELIPRISKQTGTGPSTTTSRARERSDSVGTDSSMDTTFLLKDTEAVMAFLEAKLREENKLDGGADPPSYNREDSISPESDVDTASTISLVAGDTEKKSVQKRRSLSSLYKEKSSTSSPARDLSKYSTTSSREKLEKKAKSRSSDTSRSFQTSGRARQPSFDLTDDDQTSSVPHSTISDILSSDQETYSGKSLGRPPFTSTDDLLHSKLESRKSTKSKAASTPASSTNKSTTLPRPRPTRTSLLRRARLGEASDTELADADKASVASEVSTTSSTTSRPPSGRKTPSRIDLLAQPRRTRLGSISARSDSEATITRSSITSRTPDSAIRSGLRSSSAADSKVPPRMRANSISRMPDSRNKTSAPAHSSASEISLRVPSTEPAVEQFSVSSRWRRFPTDYASTSEDEFASSRNSPKHIRLHTSTTLRSTRIQTMSTAPQGATTLHHMMKEQEEYIRDWTAHSEEIARISQDLALIAREINSVAGEIDSVSSSGTAPSTTVSTAATTPVSAIDTREEVGDPHGGMHKLVDRVFDESLNFRKIPPSSHGREPDGNSKAPDARSWVPESLDPQAAAKRRTWNRDEAVLNHLPLTSVRQLSQKIRQSVDRTAGKIRVLFKDKERNWDEIENKLCTESEVPILKTSNKEISSILQELKRVEKQLQVINLMIDPDGTLDALNSLGLTSPALPPQPKQKSSQSLIPPQSQLESRPICSNTVSATSQFDNIGSEADFSIHFNRFNPDGEEEDASVNE
ncbi:centrosomal protein of 170 kDa isoform X5 [Latimeria chalumnae]|uniref:centrosomal protein of 170 kDa isoform X5 n=1 Tax=Latimeria chalumnae TaxID=7897 RepID=UPI0006D91A65|nr:PREDICTED: centrosomal protein of 170 kDa isoform X8 [Latimeria chalumnae]|eukprot:XP_014345172.1 PREDICTED: centrosomal protein of 170 kDa isoform X8 [Latimeria chalumnae]